MRLVNLPLASSRPPGSTTIGVTVDQRDNLRDGVIYLALGTLAVGLAAGYVMGQRKRSDGLKRAQNPQRRRALPSPKLGAKR